VLAVQFSVPQGVVQTPVSDALHTGVSGGGGRGRCSFWQV